MTSWEVFFRLNHRFSNTELAYWLYLFNSPACKVTQTEDGSYYLTACRFEKLAEDHEVHESAKKLITMMTAFAKIELDTDFQSVERNDDEDVISCIQESLGDKTKFKVYAQPANAYAFGLPVRVEIRDINGNLIPQPRQERWYDYLLDRCDEKIDDTILRVLFYFARRTSWYNLYKVYELILFDINNKNEHKAEKRILKNKWVEDKDKLHDFRFSATHYDFLVRKKENIDLDESRHSEAYYQRQSKGDKTHTSFMYKPEATKLIGGLIKEWLKSKNTTS